MCDSDSSFGAGAIFGPPRERTFSEGDWEVLSAFWYPVALAADVPADRPYAVKLLDLDLVVCRTSTGFFVARDLCIHRGAPLSRGWMREDTVVCPYHGYRYDCAGRCTLVPSHPDWQIPEKLRLQTFPVVERYGLLWTCLAGEAKNALPDWTPEAEDADYRWFTMGPEIWNCSAGRAIENFIDNAHFSFVHQGTFGQESSATMGTDYAFTQDALGMTMAFDYLAANPADSPIGEVAELRRRMHRTLFFPFCTRTAITYPGGRVHTIHINIAPVTARTSQLIVVFARNFDHEKSTEELLAWERKILSEDRAIIEAQKPEEIPLDIAAEVHAKADRSSVAYRRWLKGLGLGRELTA